MDQVSGSTGMRFLSFANDGEDAEKQAKLKEAALKIEQAIAKERALSELVDYVPPTTNEELVDLANDTRPLYERLLEQRNKKQEAFDESHKLSNLVTKLDEDEASYLDEVARNKQKEELKKRLEVYDALEEKKRLDAKRILDEETKMKESLLGSRMGSASTSLKSKLLSKIKVKPKTVKPTGELVIPPDSSAPLNDNVDELTDSDRQTRSSTRNSNRANATSGSAKRSTSVPKQADDTAAKRLKTNDNDGNKDEESDSETPISRGTCTNYACTSNQVMKCIGILPSLPLVRKFRDSSDDSDNSDDDLNRRIVPRIGRSK